MARQAVWAVLVKQSLRYIAPACGPVVVGQTVYFVGGGADLYALDRDNGRVLWTFTAFIEPGGSRLARIPCTWRA